MKTTTIMSSLNVFNGDKPIKIFQKSYDVNGASSAPIPLTNLSSSSKALQSFNRFTDIPLSINRCALNIDHQLITH